MTSLRPMPHAYTAQVTATAAYAGATWSRQSRTAVMSRRRLQTVQHSAGEYARGDVTTNTGEGFFGIFTRGLVGVYQHCSEQHLQRYLDEFAFRYSHRARLGVNDDARAVLTTQGMDGKRLTFRRIDEA